jgi:hypothetical protein
MDNESSIPNPGKKKPERVDAEQQKFDARVDELVAQASPEDRSRALEVASGEPDAIRITLTPVLAALIFRQHNGRNRDFTLARAKKWARAMRRDEWRLTHQGIAFAAGTNKLSDGQHRCAAVVMSERPIEVYAFRRQNPDVIDAIDQSDKRTAWEALKLTGITDPKEKEQVARAVMHYTRRFEGQDEPPSVIEVEQYVLDHDDALGEALKLGHDSVQAESAAAVTMKATDAASLIHLMQVGDNPPGLIHDFIFTLQKGVDQREGSVIVPMARIFMKSSRAEQRRDKLSRLTLHSTVLKAFIHWARGERVASFKPVKSSVLTPYRLADVVQPQPSGTEAIGPATQPSV